MTRLLITFKPESTQKQRDTVHTRHLLRFYVRRLIPDVFHAAHADPHAAIVDVEDAKAEECIISYCEEDAVETVQILHTGSSQQPTTK